jgi:hypothetical protein
MRLRDVDYFTWVLYEGQAYNVREIFGCNRELRHSDGIKIRIRFDTDVEVLEVPKFNVGESVIFTGNVQSKKGKMMKITHVNDELKYRPYTLDDIIYVTPFEIIPVNY